MKIEIKEETFRQLLMMECHLYCDNPDDTIIEMVDEYLRMEKYIDDVSNAGYL